MSYILEALRRAEAERQRGSVPNLHTPVVDAPALLPPEPRGLGRRVWLGLGAVALLLAGWFAAPQVDRAWRAATAPASTVAPAAPAAGGTATGGSLAGASSASAPAGAASGGLNAQGGPQATASASATAQPVTGSAPRPAPPVKSSKSAQSGQSTQVAKPSATPQGSEVRRPPPSTSTPSKQAVNRPAPAAGASPAPDRKPPKPSDGTVSKGSQGAAPQPARRLSELPEPVRRRIPTLTLGGVVYSSVPASRLVVVNGQVLREGESAGKGVKLERVTPLGAIFSFDGYRFEILQ